MIARINDHNGDLKGFLYTDNSTVKASPNVTFILDPKFVVKRPGTGKVLTKDDGDDFLKALSLMFSGSGMQAALFKDPKVTSNA